MLSDQEACDVVRQQLEKVHCIPCYGLEDCSLQLHAGIIFSVLQHNTGADALARQLVEAAFNRGSGDNISAAVSVCQF